MFKNSKITLRYPQYKPILDNYLSLPEFQEKAAETMRGKRVTITSLCNYLGDSGITSFQACTPRQVTEFMESISNLSSSTKSGKLFILRHFFNYLYDENHTIFSGKELFPVIVSNKRERNTIEFIQFKTNVPNQLPLLENIKFVLIDYLKNARPSCESDLVFVGIKNNYQMISASQIHSIVSKYFTLAGIDISKRKHGPHALRHSLASSLLMNNTPMYVIKDVLGHTNLNTTRAYLSIDVNTLLNFALEVPYENNH